MIIKKYGKSLCTVRKPDQKLRKTGKIRQKSQYAFCWLKMENTNEHFGIAVTVEFY